MLKTEMYKKFIVFSILVVLNSHSMILSMEKDDDNATSIVVTQLDKEEKKVLLNIIAMGETFFNNTQHMLRFLKKIAKHAPYGIAPDAEEREYPNIPFELPGDESYVIRFKDAALKYIFVSDSSLDALHYIKNNDEEAEINNKKRLDKLVYNKHSNFDPKTFSSGKLTAKVLFGYQFFGRSTQGFFADPKDIKVFNQQCLHPKSLLYFLQSKQTIKIGNKPVKKDFDTAIDKDIYHYASLLYAFKKLLDFECQVPLYNLVKCDSYLNSHGINTKKFAELLKTQYLKEHYFKQFIPLLAQENSIVNDYTLFNTTKSSINEAKISDKKIKKAFEFLKRDEKTITSFDTIHNALFGLCFTMSKTRAIPNNLANIIHSVESKLNAILEHREKYIDPLYSTYKDLYSQHTLKYYGFWGNRLLQKTIHLPEEIFSGHTSPTLKEKIKIAEHKKEVELLAREAQAAQAARELLAEYGEGAQEELVM
ncbi:MAG TPA: hypothetical protein VL201_02240, partial [Patescibacteria group bacterium]|nr:hypothetical protein [Patescibacteria group bacterium]